MTGIGAENFSFLNTFVGREAELTKILDSWQCACCKTAQFTVLLADSRLGKTRLIHEFYRRVSAAEGGGEAGEKYWPDLLDDNPVTLRINPDMSTGSRFIKDMPWFWLGIRWQPPSRRNAEGSKCCGLLNGDTQKAIQAHREPFRRHLDKLSKTANAGKTLGAAAISLIPVIGPLYGMGKSSYNIVKVGVDAIKAPGPERSFDCEESHSAQKKDAEDLIRDFLVALLDSEHKELPTIPVILVLDDAQWADATTLQFVRKLFFEAVLHQWPLMVIATCWETEWKEQGDLLASNQLLETAPVNIRVLAEQLRSLVEPKLLRGDWLKHYREITLPPLRDPQALEPLIDAAFPGLGEVARHYLLSKSSGNPGILAEFLVQLKETSSPFWFCQKDFGKDLTPAGLEELYALPTACSEIVAKRIKRLEHEDSDTYRVLELAGTQGLRFYGSLISEVAKFLPNCCINDFQHALGRAETPRNFVTLFPDSLFSGEFKDRMARELLYKSCKANWPGAIKELCRLLQVWLISECDKTDERAEHLLLLLLEVSAPERAPELSYNFKLRIPALGYLVKGLQARQHFGEAVSRAREIWQLSAGIQMCLLLDVLPLETHFSVARCLLETTDVDALLSFIDEHLAREKTDADMNVVQWMRLKARALHRAERYDTAINVWTEAVSIANDVPASPQYNKSMEVCRLYVGLGQSWHLKEGWLPALNAYRKADAELQSCKSVNNYGFLELRLASQIYMGIAESLYDAGNLSGAVEAMSRAESFLEKWKDVDPSNSSVLELLAQCLMRQGAWAPRLTGGDPMAAVTLLMRALQLRKDRVRLVGETAETLSALAASHSVLAGALSHNGKIEQALLLVEQAVRFRKEIIRRVGDQTAVQRQFALTLTSRGDIHRIAKCCDEALCDYMEACSKREKIVKEHEPKWTHQLRKDYRFLHYSWRKCGEIHLERMSLRNASINLRKALLVSRQIRREFTELRGFANEVIDLRDEYILWEILGRLAEVGARQRIAVRRYRIALALLEKLNHRYGLSVTGRSDRERIQTKAAQLCS